MQNVLLFDLGDIVRADLKFHCDSLRALGFASRLQMSLMQRENGPSPLSLTLIGKDKKKYQAVCSLIEEQGYLAPNFHKWEFKNDRAFSLQNTDSDNVWFLTINNTRRLDHAIKLWSTDDGNIELSGFNEFPRILREALHLPTARPMSSDQREGGLVSLPAKICKNVLYMALINDYSFEAIAFENTIVVYTENSDTEDALLKNEGSRLISRAINKSRLFICENGFFSPVYNRIITGNKISLVKLNKNERMSTIPLRPRMKIEYI